MEDRKSVSTSVVTTTISALAVVATLAGGGVAWLMTRPVERPIAITPSAPTVITPIQGNSPLPTKLPTVPDRPNKIDPSSPDRSPTTTVEPKSNSTFAQKNENTVKIWRLDDNGKKTFLVAQERQVAPSNSNDPDLAVKRPMDSLIASAGKPDGKLTSTIPVGTKLLSAKVKPDGIHIDLSKEFVQSGGATSAIGRLGQVIYTATTDNPTAPVWISVEGKPIEVLGDIGVEIRQPITRQMYDRDFPINPDKSSSPN